MKQKGFTLIELMITLAIMGILSMMAIPFYGNYVTKSKVSEALTIVQAYKSNLIEHYVETNECLDNALGAVGGIPAASEISGNYLMRIRTGQSGAQFILNGELYRSTCVMSLVFTNSDKVPKDLRTKALRIRLAINDGSIISQCSTERDDRYKLPWQYLPSFCHNY